MTLLLTGKEEYALDDKGRLMIPAKFRKEMKDASILFLMMMLEKTIWVYQKKEWEEHIEREVQKLSDFDESQRKIKFFIYANSEKVELDKQKRISIPKRFIEECGIEKDVVIIGAGDKLIISSPNYFSKLNTEQKEKKEMDQLMKRFLG